MKPSQQQRTTSGIEPVADADDANAADSGAIVLGWLTKLALVGALVGVLGFDGISVGVGHFSATDEAGDAAQAASQAYQSSRNPNTAYAAALATLTPGETIPASSVSITPDGTTTLTMTKTVRTLLLYRTKSTAGLAKITVKVTGKYTGS